MRGDSLILAQVTEKHFILATAGHVDHGKSALVKALTGTDPDRLPEEKARGISIELGFAQLILPGPDEERFHVGIVDVPGHEDFVRNMIGGVGSIDLALLVVAADDGWMPQTEEHLQILIYLGVKRALIALTKSDLGKIDNIAVQIRHQLRNSAFTNSHIIPTSVRTGEGIENLKRALTHEFATLSPQHDIGKARLFVDRAFTLRGIGTVVTGTLTGGKLRRGQNVIIRPQNASSRIRSIQSHGRDLEFAEPGMRTALNLPDIGIGTARAALKRGDVITVADFGRPSVMLDVLLEKSPRLNRSDPAARPLKNGTSFYVHHGTARVSAKIAFLEDEALVCGESLLARLRLKSPILALLGDRFVVRDSSEQHTIAGGIVLDPDTDRSNFQSAGQKQLLKRRASAPHNVHLCLQSELARSGVAGSKTLLHKSRFSQDEIASALLLLQSRGAIVLRGEIAAAAGKWRELVHRASELIDTTHKEHPEKRGLELAELRAALSDQSADAFDALISDLCANSFVRAGTSIARASHHAVLPPQIQPAVEKIRTALSAKPFDPPARKQIAQDRHLQQALRFLIEQGEVVEIGADAVLSQEAFTQMKEAVTAFISKNDSATVSELRQALETSRRIIVPLLERLDRERTTRRIGDRRTLVDEIVATSNIALD